MRFFLFLFFSTVFAGPLFPGEPPNILFVCTDDHSYRTVSSDPDKLANLARSPGRRARVLALWAACIQEPQRCGAGMVGTLPPVADFPSAR